MADLIEIGVTVNTNIKEATADLDKMGGSVVNNIRTVDRLETEIKQLNKALNAGRLSENAYRKGMQQVNGELLLFQQRAAKAAKVERRFGTAAATGGKSMNRFNVALQQGGFQLQDFAVQLQSGTSFFTAFGQQGSQFAGIFGPQGAVIGAIIAVGSALGGFALATLKVEKDTRSLQDTLDDLTKSVSEYADAMGAARDSSAAATKEFGFTSSILQSVIEDFKTLARIEAFEDLGASVSKLRSEHISGFESDIENIKDLLRLEGAFAAAGADVAQFDSLLKNLENSSLSLGERLSSAMSLKDILLENSGGINQMEADQKSFYNSLLVSIQQMEVLRGLTQGKGRVDILGSEEGLRVSTEALNELFESRLGTIDDTANKYVDILGSEESLKASTEALNKLFESKLETQERINKGYAKSVGLTQTLSNEIEDYVKSTAEGFKQTQALKEKIGESAFEAMRLAGYDIASGVEDAADAAEDLGTRLGIAFSDAINIIRQAKAEAMVGLDAFGGAGEFKYSTTSEIKAKSAKKAAKGLSEAAEAAKDLADEALRLNEANDPLLKFNKGIDNLNKLMKTGKLTQKAYNGEVAKLQDGLADSIPLVGDISDAFGDFVARGLKDFKGFVQQILGSFTSMISQMIATAARNKIMLSMGIGGTGIAGKAAGLGGSSGPLGSFIGSFGSAGVAGTGLLGGAGAAMPAFLGGAGNGMFAVGANAAAAGGGIAASIGAAIPPLLAVTAVLGLFIKKTKVLDTGLRATVEGFDVAVETFEKTQTSRLFGLLKGKKRTGYAGASAEVADPLVKAVGEIQQSVLDAADTLGIGVDAFDNFSYQFKVSLKGLSEEEQFQKVTQELNKMGDSFASLSGHFETMNELLTAANKRMELRNRMDKLLNNNAAVLARQREAELSAMHALNRPLAQAVYLLEDAQSAVTNAFAALRASIDSVVSDLKDKLGLANEAMNKSKSIYETLSDALRSRKVSGDEAFSGRREAAVSFLRRGVFGDERKLQNALGVVAEPSEQMFGSFVDYARDFGLTGNVIAKAAETAKVQLSADEQAVELLETQIETFDAQLQIMVNQYNALLGIDTSVKSVSDAMSALRSALGSFASAQGAAKATASAKVPQAKETAAALEEVTIVRTFKGGNDFLRNGASGVELSNGQVFKTEDGWGDSKEIKNATKKAREAVIAAGGIPKFATGGMHSGGLRMVGERGPELEATGPARIFSHNQTSGLFKDPDLKEAVNELRREVSGLRDEQRQMGAASAKYAKRNYDINRKWDTDGLPSTRT